MDKRFSRLEMILGAEKMARLAKSRVAVFGLGGVGSYAVEALARGGVGALSLTDHDTVSESNINRQLFALDSTVGRLKTEAAAERLRDINPQVSLEIRSAFFDEQAAADYNFKVYDFIVDAIDTVSAKILLIKQAKEAGTPIICSMGTGNKLRPELLRIADIEMTSVCPLARVMRRELKKRNIGNVPVVFSAEEPLEASPLDEAPLRGMRQVPGSTSFVPAAAGLLLAAYVIRHLVADSGEGLKQ